MVLPIFWMSPQVYSQNTGIGTTNPQAKLHVDGSSNNSATGVPSAAQQADDFVVLSNGNVGIGTVAPSVKIEVKSAGTVAAPRVAIRINDGSEAVGKVLTSDANGNALWKYVALNEIKGVLAGAGAEVPLDTRNFYSTGSYVDLGPGKWRVSVTILLRTIDETVSPDTWAWVRSTFSENGTLKESADLEKPNFVSGMYQGPYKKFSLMTGSVIINNKTTGTKRYTYIAGNTDFGGGTALQGAITLARVGSSLYSENIITAFPILW